MNLSAKMSMLKSDGIKSAVSDRRLSSARNVGEVFFNGGCTKQNVRITTSKRCVSKEIFSVRSVKTTETSTSLDSPNGSISPVSIPLFSVVFSHFVNLLYCLILTQYYLVIY